MPSLLSLPSTSENQTGYQLINGIKKIPSVKFDDSTDFFGIYNYTRDSSVLWNSLLPYRLLILVANNTSADPSQTTYDILNSNSGLGVPAIYSLPISPQNISLQMPFASQTTVLSDGILVENNGIPLRQIMISGTTGVLPFRQSNVPSYNSTLGGLGGSSVRAATNVASAASSIGSAFSSGAGNVPPEQLQSGYELWHRLSEFLQIYALLAKKPENSNIRLAFDMAKDNCTYLCTPKMFTLTRSADSPLEYKYSIQLEAWKRIKISGYNSEDTSTNYTNGIFSNLSKVQAALQTLQQVANVIRSGENLLNAVRADAQTLSNYVRQAILLAKDIAGVAVTAIDLPGALITDLGGPVLGAVDDVVNAWKGVIATGNNFKNNIKQSVQALSDLSNQISTDANAPASLYATQQSSSVLSGLTSAGNPSASNPGPAGGATAPTATPASIVGSILSNPNAYAPFLDAINLDNLTIPSNLQSKIDAEVTRVGNLTRQDFANQKLYVKQFQRDFDVFCGLGSTVYDQAAGYVSVQYPSVNRQPSRDELQVMFAMQQFIGVLNDFSRFEISGDNSINQSFAYIGQLAQSAGINIDQTQGKIAVPVPYGKTIQDIAEQFLGDPDQATEIILLNGLKPPYVDETGTTLPFLSNGNGNSFSISDGSGFWIGQKVLLSSLTNPSYAQTVVNIQMINATNWVITVDGLPNLGNLTTVQNASVQFFQRGTVSSRDSIFIPSPQLPSNIPDRLKPLPFFFKDLDGLASFTGVDLALGTNNDLIMDGHGNLGLVGGMANLQQALKMKFITPQGSLRRHKHYGFPVQPGTSTADINFSDLGTGISQLIGADKRFGEISGLRINLTGPVLAISGAVSVNANGKVLPFSLNVTT